MRIRTVKIRIRPLKGLWHRIELSIQWLQKKILFFGYEVIITPLFFLLKNRPKKIWFAETLTMVAVASDFSDFFWGGEGVNYDIRKIIIIIRIRILWYFILFSRFLWFKGFKGNVIWLKLKEKCPGIYWFDIFRKLIDFMSYF